MNQLPVSKEIVRDVVMYGAGTLYERERRGEGCGKWFNTERMKYRSYRHCWE